MQYDLVIKNARLFDEDGLKDILIKDGLIHSITSDFIDEAKEVIDAAGKVVTPGFIEPHIHLEKALLFERKPTLLGTLDEAIQVTGQLKKEQEYEDVKNRIKTVLEMAIKNGTTTLRAHPDVDPIQHLIGVETLIELKKEYESLIDIQIVAFPQEGLIKAPETFGLMERAIKLGANVVGGCPYNEKSWDDTKLHINAVFDMAEKYGLDVDMHADFSDDPSDLRFSSAEFIAQETIKRGFQGRVSLGHVTSLGSIPKEKLNPILDLLSKADISIVTLPATDTYLGGRKDEFKQRRGLTPVRELQQKGVNVAYSSNNIRNAFTPFGKADMLLIGNMLAHLIQYGTYQEQRKIIDMATINAAKAIGLGNKIALKPGKQADLVIYDCNKLNDLLSDVPTRLWVIKGGRVTVTTRHECCIHH